MKKLGLMIAAVGLLSTTAYATPDYFSSAHPNYSKSLTSRSIHPPVDISIVNATIKPIYTVVPNTQIDDLVLPGMNYHIFSYDPRITNTLLVLQDPHHKTFFAEKVCNLAIVTVFGYPGYYTTSVDTELCR